MNLSHSGTSSTDAGTAIAIFVYNRPQHTARLLQSLVAAGKKIHSRIFVFSDGPKPEISGDEALVDEARNVCRAFSEVLDISLFGRPENLGLARSITMGVNHIFEHYSRIIVLEDDLLLAESFFPFMYEMLGRFEVSPKVFHISGYMCPAKRPLPAVGLFRVPGSWGWATWRHAWSHYSHDVMELMRGIEEKGIRGFNVDGAYDHFATLRENLMGTRSTWAVRWYASMFLQGAFSIYPARSLVGNDGFDGSGTNCGRGDHLSRIKGRKQKSEWGDKVSASVESPQYLDAFTDFYYQLAKLWIPKRSILEKVRARLLRRC